MSQSDFLAAVGMGLIIGGVCLFLIRDLRYRYKDIGVFFDRFENRVRYIPFIAPASAMIGVLLILIAFAFD